MTIGVLVIIALLAILTFLLAALLIGTFAGGKAAEGRQTLVAAANALATVMAAIFDSTVALIALAAAPANRLVRQLRSLARDRRRKGEGRKPEE